MEQRAIVPISHYFPKDLKIVVNGKTKYYYPPKRKYLRLDMMKAYISEEEIFDWITMVILRLDPSDKYTYKWFDRYISEFYPGQDKFHFAKDYLIKKFLKDVNYFKSEFSKHNNKIFVHKEDLIKFWYDNQYKNYGVVYDFSNVPEISEFHDKISLQCLNHGPDGNPMGQCSSVINYFFDGRLMENRIMLCWILRGWKIKRDRKKNILERHSKEEILEAIKASDGIHEVLGRLGETKNGWNSSKIKEFIEANNVEISHFKSLISEEYYKNPKLCPICGKPISYHSKNSKKQQECCSRECSKELQRRQRFEKFVKRANKVHGNSYEYKLKNFNGMKKNMLIHDKIFNEDFYQQPGNHERGAGNCTKNMSSGERLVYLWLLNNNLLDSTKFQYTVDGEIQGVNTMRVIIDFRIIFNNKEYWVEYNGEQHYVFRAAGILSKTPEYANLTREEKIEVFKKHLDRDNNVKEYCKSHNITFIEIPYTKETYTGVSKILERVIFEGKPNNVKIPKVRIL